MRIVDENYPKIIFKGEPIENFVFGDVTYFKEGKEYFFKFKGYNNRGEPIGNCSVLVPSIKVWLNRGMDYMPNDWVYLINGRFEDFAREDIAFCETKKGMSQLSEQLIDDLVGKTRRLICIPNEKLLEKEPWALSNKKVGVTIWNKYIDFHNPKYKPFVEEKLNGL